MILVYLFADMSKMFFFLVAETFRGCYRYVS